jgi:hypothetical protein
VRAYTSSKGGTAASIEIARKGLEAAAKDAKDTIWSLLGSDLKGNKGVPYVNGEQITTVYLDLLKEVNKSVADAKAVVEPASAEKKPDGAKGGAGTPAPSEEKRENPDTVIGELGIGKQVAALKSALTLKRVSKPGQRMYQGSRDLKPVMRGFGIAVVTTSLGLLTDKEARKQKVGGEVLCTIY